MNYNEVQQGDVGLTIELRLSDEHGNPVDLTDATELKMRYKKQSSVSGEFPASVIGNPIDGVIGYTTVSESDLDEVGIWYFQAYARFASNERWPSSVGKIHVKKNLT